MNFQPSLIAVLLLFFCNSTLAQPVHSASAVLPDEVILRDLPPGTFMIVKSLPRLNRSYVDYVTLDGFRGGFGGECRILDSEINQRFEFFVGRKIIFSHSRYKVYPEEPLRDRVIVWSVRLTAANNSETTELQCATKVPEGDLHAKDLKRIFYGDAFFLP